MQRLPVAEFEAVVDVLPVAGRALTAQHLRAAIALIAEERMADVAHVGTYLMRAAGL